MKRGRPGKKILCINDGKKYESLAAAANQYKVSSSAISQTLNDKRHSVKGLYFVSINGCETNEEIKKIQIETLADKYNIFIV